jgi:hypothetical protein
MRAVKASVKGRGGCRARMRERTAVAHARGSGDANGGGEGARVTQMRPPRRQRIGIPKPGRKAGVNGTGMPCANSRGKGNRKASTTPVGKRTGSGKGKRERRGGRAIQ